jgi:hypothetical protein
MVQVGVEGTPGVEVDANKQLEAYSITPKRTGKIDTFRPDGMKFATLASAGKEQTDADVSGILDYANIVYMLAGLIGYASPAQQGTTSAYLWTFTPDTDGPDTIKTFTVEHGSSVRAQQFEYGTVIDWGFSFGAQDGSIPVKGAMIGTQLRDGITKTSTPASVVAVPAVPKQFTVKIADAQASLAGATALDRVLNVEFGFTGKQGPVFTVGTAASFVATAEKAPDLGGSITLEADANGMAYLTVAQAGTQKWIQIKATGDTIADAYAYDIEIQMPVVFTTLGELSDADGVVAVKYGIQAVHDGTWGKALQVKVVNTLTGL